MENRKDYTWAIFLIFLGSVLLLNTTGILDWNVWLYILSYWPIFLILGGLRLIIGKSLISTIILSSLALVAFSWIGICSYINQTENPGPFFENFRGLCVTKNIEDVEMVEKEYTVDNTEFDDIEEVEYDINLGVSEFSITDGGDEYLYLNAQYTAKFEEPKIETRAYNETLFISVEEESIKDFTPFNWKSPQYVLVTGSELPSTFNINNGVGRGSVVFDSQQIKKLKIDTGTGDMNVKLSFESIPSEELVLNTGTGKMELSIPFDVGYEISFNLGVGSISLDNKQISGFDKDEDSLRSKNYDTAAKIVKIDADVGVGQLIINSNN